jgi:hypothetical protein
VPKLDPENKKAAKLKGTLSPLKSETPDGSFSIRPAFQIFYYALVVYFLLLMFP